MDGLIVFFPVSGVETWLFVPPLAAFLVSLCTSMGGVSGAFMLLPFQVSVLGFTSPAVTSTNLVYNIVAIPSGVYRYVREGRMAWPLAWTITAGTLPGLFLGYLLRVVYLPDPADFKPFAGLVLLAVGMRLLSDRTARSLGRAGAPPGTETALREQSENEIQHTPSPATVRTVRVSLKEVAYDYWGERYCFSVPGMLLLSLAVGIVGGAYGIGGGAIIAPFCVSFFRLPVHSVAGASLFATFMTSALGVLIYALLPGPTGIATRPDWLLGALFGAGGLAGMYMGARLQKYVSHLALTRLLGVMITAVAATYLVPFVFR